VRDRVGVTIATCAGVGYAPIAPGTFGSAAGLLLFWLLRSTGSLTIELGVIVLVWGLGVWSAAIAERALGKVDPAPVVIDEVLGMLVTLAAVPVGAAGAVTGFFLFRALDIVKPWPARRFERLHGGLGVMADDAMAAVYGNLVMHGLVAALPGWLG
jgi:phosphatidylglycerophosphatase A